MPPAYPATRTVDVSEQRAGRSVADPYRWLEELTNPEVQAWMDDQQAVAEGWLGGVGARPAIRDRLERIVDHPRRGAPWRRGDHWFQLRNPGLAAHDVVWVADTPDAEGRPLLDPNQWSVDGTVALSALAVTHEGAQVAYAVSERGSDWMTWRVRDVATLEDRPDVVRWSKASTAAWHPDGSGFWYGAYEAPPDDATYDAATRAQWLAFHRLGTDQSDDEVVWHHPGEDEWIFEPEVTDDGRWLVITAFMGTDPRSKIAVADLHRGGDVTPLLDGYDAAYELVGSVGDDLLLLTDADAPLGRIVAVAADGSPTSREAVAADGPPALREVVAEGHAAIDRASVAGDRLLLVRLVDAAHRVQRYHLDGRENGEIDLGGAGTVQALTGRAGDDVVHVAVESFTRPATVLRHDLTDATTVPVFVPDTAHDPDALVTEQVFVDSPDGTRVPMFLVHRRGLTESSAEEGHPTLLWGYGGFSIPVTPMHRAHWTAWVDAGGVLAVANLRGGGEYGQQWHDAGRLRYKQNVFDDALACAAWLCETGWTRPERLAIKGRSNGGLLAGACLTQAPAQFKAAVVEVGVLDLLRFHHSTIGWAWKSDFGDPDDDEDAATLLDYSPYHNIRPGTAYPATLITTGDHDDRVVPWHSLKFAAAVQAAQAGDEPVLLRVDRSGGHGAGKPLAKALDERADVLAFLSAVLGMSEEAWK